jgi:hypothetical protein
MIFRENNAKTRNVNSLITSVESLIYVAAPLPANFYFGDHVLGTCRLTRRVAIKIVPAMKAACT